MGSDPRRHRIPRSIRISVKNHPRKKCGRKAELGFEKEPEEEAEPPKIGRLTVDEGKLIYRDPKTETDVVARIFTNSSGDAREMPLNVAAEGKFTGLEFKAQAQGGKIMSLADKTHPYPIKARAEVGTTLPRLKVLLPVWRNWPKWT